MPLMKRLSDARFQSIVIGALLIGAALYLMVRGGVIMKPDTSVQKGELSLAGVWKIKFDDRIDYAKPTLRDDDWCLIGVPDPSLRGDEPVRQNCPTERYPINQMRGHVYWYRTSFTVPVASRWSKPSLFLGGIKTEYRVYLDGRFVGPGARDRGPAFYRLGEDQIGPGVHVLAVRVSSDSKEPYPGIVHAFARKIAIGEYSRDLASWQVYAHTDFAERFAVFVLQFLSLSLLIFLALRSAAITDRFLWLTMYFGFSSLYSGKYLVPPFYGLLASIGAGGMSLAMVGLSLSLFSTAARQSRVARASILLTTIGYVGFELVAFWLPVFPSGAVAWIMKSVVFASLLSFLGGLAIYFVRKKIDRNYEASLAPQDWAMVASILVLHVLFTLATSSIVAVIPAVQVSVLMNIIVIASAIEDHVTKEKHLAFFGRFIRRGLKELLTAHERKAIAGEKIFRGKEVAILKIDIIGHTATTYGMPYGMKRLYQDCWFTSIDHMVAEMTFMDKGLGDGSFYYFENDPNGKTCSDVLTVSKQIRDFALKEFDVEYRRRLKELLVKEPALREPVEQFRAQYRERTGFDFLQKETKARFVLAYGFVDEGLWGMMSKGHYDVEGDLVTLTARLEKAADAGQIISNERFVEKLAKEDLRLASQLKVEWKTAELKGIGTHRYALLVDVPGMLKKAA